MWVQCPQYKTIGNMGLKNPKIHCSQKVIFQTIFKFPKKIRDFTDFPTNTFHIKIPFKFDFNLELQQSNWFYLTWRHKTFTFLSNNIITRTSISNTTQNFSRSSLWYLMSFLTGIPVYKFFLSVRHWVFTGTNYIWSAQIIQNIKFYF